MGRPRALETLPSSRDSDTASSGTHLPPCKCMKTWFANSLLLERMGCTNSGPALSALRMIHGCANFPDCSGFCRIEIFPDGVDAPQPQCEIFGNHSVYRNYTITRGKRN